MQHRALRPQQAEPDLYPDRPEWIDGVQGSGSALPIQSPGSAGYPAWRQVREAQAAGSGRFVVGLDRSRQVSSSPVPDSFNVTVTLSPSVYVPSMRALARGSPMWRWMIRLRGRAP